MSNNRYHPDRVAFLAEQIYLVGIAHPEFPFSVDALRILAERSFDAAWVFANVSKQDGRL